MKARKLGDVVLPRDLTAWRLQRSLDRVNAALGHRPARPSSERFTTGGFPEDLTPAERRRVREGDW